MASPQKENGFTAISNELLEAILKENFTLRELKILFAIIRYTFGFGRKAAELSNRFLAKATYIRFQHVNSALTDLENKNVIKFQTNPRHSQGRIILLNKDYESWVLNRNQKSDGLIINSSQKSDGSVPKEVTVMPKKVTETVTKTVTKKENNKENFKENIFIEPTHEIQVFVKKNCVRVSELPQQLTHSECDKLLMNYETSRIQEILLSMENYKPLLKNYESVYLTALNWLKRNGKSNNGKNSESNNFKINSKQTFDSLIN